MLWLFLVEAAAEDVVSSQSEDDSEDNENQNSNEQSSNEQSSGEEDSDDEEGETSGSAPSAADLIKDATDASFRADVLDASRETPWSRHSSGRINTAHDRFDEPATTLDELRAQFRLDQAPSAPGRYTNGSSTFLLQGDEIHSAAILALYLTEGQPNEAHD